MDITFRDCGLDLASNMLVRPKCDCGCGGYLTLVLEDKHHLAGVIYDLLEKYECDHCAIFAICLDDSIVMGIKLTDGIKIYTTTMHGDINACEEIAAIQEDWKFHCCGLLEEITLNEYEIIVE